MTTPAPAARPEQPARTIAITPGTRRRLSRPRLRYPAGGPRSRPLSRLSRAWPDPGPSARYTPELAAELLASTCTMPATRHDLMIVLTEHRRALRALVTQPAEGNHPR